MEGKDGAGFHAKHCGHSSLRVPGLSWAPWVGFWKTRSAFPIAPGLILSRLGRMPATPEADPRFSEFVILQAQNAGLFLGQIPNPHTGEKVVNLRAAKSVIDSLEMLASTTRGNLTASEEKLLHTAIQKLKPLYQSAQAC